MNRHSLIQIDGKVAMKAARVLRHILITVALGYISATSAYAQSTTADEMASCSASFHLTCVDTSSSDVTVNSESSAVPIKGMGDGGLEIVLFLILLFSYSIRRKYLSSREAR